MFNKYVLKNNRGFSLVEALVATGLVATSVLAIGYMATQINKVSDKARVKQEIPGALSDALNRSRMMLLNTQDAATGLRTRGICTMLVPQRVAAGIVPVDLVLANATKPGNEMYSAKSWENLFKPDWSLSSFKKDSLGGISFKLKATANNPYIPKTGVDLKSVVVSVNISLKVIDPSTSSTLFAPLPSLTKTIDAKKAVYDIQAVLDYKSIDAGGKSVANSDGGADIVSVIDVGSCDLRNAATGQLFTLSPAGTGIGDPTGRSIYNNTEFKAPGQKPMELYLLTREVTRGKFVANKLSADRAHDKVAACTESVFKCSKNKGKREYRPFINVDADINYFSQNMFGYQESIQVIPELSIYDEKTKTDLIKKHGAVVEYGNSLAVNFRQGSDSLYYPLDAAGNLTLTSPMSFVGGVNSLTSTVSNVQNMCSNICQPSYADDAKIKLTISTPNFGVTAGKYYEQSSTSSQGLHCTMCWMKGCTRTGIKTFGTVSNMPDEPLDAQVPECAAEDTAEVADLEPYRNESIPGVGCVSAKIVGGKLEYKARSCSDSLPVMCFAFGEYTFARDLASKAIVSSNFANAQTVCRNMGRESILVSDLNATFLNMGVPDASLKQIPQSGGRYQFLNLAKVGTFVAPQGSAEAKRAIQSVEAKFPPTESQKEFWVALRKDSDGVWADIPQASKSNSVAEQHLVYYAQSGAITHSRLTTTPYDYVQYPSVSPGDRAYVVFNNPKFRGVTATTKSQSIPLPYLCLRPSDMTYFVSSTGGHNFSLGGDACAADGGIFMAPNTPRSWTQALLEVSPHGSHLPFEASYDSPKAVWIAFEGTMVPSYQGELGKLLKIDGMSPVLDYAVSNEGSYVKADLLNHTVRYEYDVKRTEKDKEGKEIEIVEKRVDYRTEPDPSVKYLVACYDKSKMSIIVRDEAKGCFGAEVRVTEANIKKRDIALAWIQSKDKFGLGSKEFVRIK